MPNLDIKAPGADAAALRLALSGALHGAPYLGQVATRCATCDNISDTNSTESMSRTIHRANDDITALQIEEQNYYIPGGSEAASGAAMLVETAIEYPLGSAPVRVQWGGANQGSIPSGQAVLSDLTPINIPKGALFARRRWIKCTSGIIYGFQHNQALGDWFAFGATTTNRVMDATLNTGNAGVFGTGVNAPPGAILAMTRRPSALIIGDSREFGTISGSAYDTGDGSGNRGPVARGIGNDIAYINQSLGGQRASQYVASHTRRALQSAYVTDVISQLAVNDIGNGRTLAQVKADLIAIAGYFPGKRIWLTTTPPLVSGTYDTSAGQTVSGAYSTIFAPLNEWKRGVPQGFAGCFDIAAAIEDPSNPGKLYPSFTTDGTHQTQMANIAAARTVRPEIIEAKHALAF